jgi:hypothetical protein
MKVTRERERERERVRVQGLQEYMEELLPMSWALLSLEVDGIVNLLGKLGASGSSLAANTQGSVGWTEQNSVVRVGVSVGRRSWHMWGELLTYACIACM